MQPSTVADPMSSDEAAEEAEPVHIMGAGLSGLAAAIILGNAGREVHVHDIRDDSGARFDGDFQGLENWTSDSDFVDELAEWGIDLSDFKTTDFHTIDLIHPDDEITKAWSPKVAFRVVERGTASHTIDQSLKRQALAAGANLHYNSRVDPVDCRIVAAGPKDTSALAFCEVFETSYPNTVAFHFNDKLAPGAYAYMIIIDGVGLSCSCLWRKQERNERFLNETLARYDKHYPELERKSVKRIGGKGDFTLNRRYKVNGRYYVGEAGGLQDFMWGFGMRYAITSGVLAAQDILGECDYETEVRRRLLPTVRASVANRWLMNRVSNRALKRLATAWMKDQEKRQDGLPFIEKMFRPDPFRWLVYNLFARWVLKRVDTDDGRVIHRLPYRGALKRDEWDPSEEAVAVGERWKQQRRRKSRSAAEEE